MTITAQSAGVKTNPVCRAALHTGTQNAWNNGCRCPEAMAAHEVWLAEKPRVKQAPLVDASGRCVAPKHDSYIAWIGGCRCPKSLKRREERRAMAMMHTARHSKSPETQRVLRVTGGRLMADPRKPWRGPLLRVGSINLWMLVRGFRDSPTTGEQIAAVAILDQRGTTAGRYDSETIATRLGISRDLVHTLRVRRRTAREERPLRRLADVKWKAVMVEQAQGRRERVAAEHAAAHERRDRRKAAARTRRRLARSKARARFHAGDFV